MKSLLAKATYELCKNTNSEDWQRLAKKARLDVSWVRAFSKGRIPDPSASRLEKLHKALTGNSFPAEV